MGSVLAVGVVFAVFAVLAVASWKWGADSRVGRDWEWRTDDPGPDAPEPPGSSGRRILRSTREFLAEQAELHERLGLMNRPWEEDFVHWSGDPADPRLHGSLPPPSDGRRRSVTRGGWCPGLAHTQPSAGRATGEMRGGCRT